MNTVTDFQFDDKNNMVSFKVNNPKQKSKYETALINGIRRSILVDINSFAINRNDVKFYKNTSVFNNDFLTMRLALLPLIHKELDKKDLDELILELKIENTTEEIIDITPEDFKISYKEQNISPNKLFAQTNMLICRLKQHQEMDIKCMITKNTHKQGGAYFCPVSKAVYKFEEDYNELQKIITQEKKDGKLDTNDDVKKFEMLKKERYYKKTDDNKPLSYCFQIESTGEIHVKDIFTIGCDLFKDRCLTIIEKINNDPNEDKVSVEQSPTNLYAYDFTFYDENDTIGNLLQIYLFYDSDVEYAGYVIPHPLDNKLVVRMSLKKNKFTENDCKKKIESCLKIIVNQIDEIKKSYLEKAKQN
jgi:DNA-directed RNA polymerase subunit L